MDSETACDFARLAEDEDCTYVGWRCGGYSEGGQHDGSQSDKMAGKLSVSGDRCAPDLTSKL